MSEKSYKDTLNLPKTEFSIRAKAATKEPELLARWEKEKLYNKVRNKEATRTFVMHDGPPFANGHMHMGHALNRILKDIVCKAKRMSGYKIVSHPGWDCHGLPIELKAIKELGADADRLTIKKKCREYAQTWINIQREEIKGLGVFTDWDHPYITMSPQYEAAILKSFAQFLEKGFIQRKGKTVPWCASCRTVLATAEIEYKEKKDPSCYIFFPLDDNKLFKDVEQEVGLLVWTTTPWTIPLNRAVLVHPKADYVLVKGKDNKAFIVGAKLADDICKKMEIDKEVLKMFSSKELEGLKALHPYVDDLKVPILLENMVLLEDGTACVHSAPGCGPEDYMVGVKHNLEIFSPLSPDGKYTEGIQPKELEGMPVSDGQIWSIKKMASCGRLLHKESLKHSYPHCWRCAEPLIFRATDQWFCDLQKDNVLERAVEAAKQLDYVPAWGKIRLSSSMASRTEWCLSRQRHWGVPIPSVICKECGNYFMDAAFVRKVADEVAKEGIEYWDRVPVEELGITCSCGGKDFEKDTDIIDVWFESGVSHTAVREVYPELTLPADVYIEASDQHRGWFQSSLLTSMIMYDTPCTKRFVTHPFVLDAKAQKMSKSKGNVISPDAIIKRYSTDIMRLWFLGSDFDKDILVSDELLKHTGEVYKKIRNTCRFMISNLYDFDVSKDAVSLHDMLEIDQYALARLQDVIRGVKKSYDDYWFTSVFQALNRYCTNDLSSFYLDIIKDRLYVEKADGLLRRSAQTAMYHILDALAKLMAPVLSFLAEEVSDYYQRDKDMSIHLQDFPEEIDVWRELSKKLETGHITTAYHGLFSGDTQTVTFGAKMTGIWNLLERMRPELLKAIEEKRAAGSIKHSLEARVTVHIAEESLRKFFDALKDKNRFLKDFIIVSQVSCADSKDGLSTTALPWLHVGVEHARGVKCPRCWQWDEVDHPDGLCRRCQQVVGQQVDPQRVDGQQ